jgi:hypothetical protein
MRGAMRGATRAPRRPRPRAPPPAAAPGASLLRRHGLVGRACAHLAARSEAHPAATLRVSRADIARLAARRAARPCEDGAIVALFCAGEPVELRSEETLLVRLPVESAGEQGEPGEPAAPAAPAAPGELGEPGKLGEPGEPGEPGQPAAPAEPAWFPLVLVAHSQYAAGLRAGAVHRALVRLDWA